MQITKKVLKNDEKNFDLEPLPSLHPTLILRPNLHPVPAPRLYPHLVLTLHPHLRSIPTQVRARIKQH